LHFVQESKNMGIATSGPDFNVLRSLNEHELRRFSCGGKSAQAPETSLFVMGPLDARQDASPAALRLAIRRTPDGVLVHTVKRKGPIGVELFDVVLKHSPATASAAA
jgi:hypothetical protein